MNQSYEFLLTHRDCAVGSYQKRFRRAKANVSRGPLYPPSVRERRRLTAAAAVLIAALARGRDSAVGRGRPTRHVRNEATFDDANEPRRPAFQVDGLLLLREVDGIIRPDGYPHDSLQPGFIGSGAPGDDCAPTSDGSHPSIRSDTSDHVFAHAILYEVQRAIGSGGHRVDAVHPCQGSCSVVAVATGDARAGHEVDASIGADATDLRILRASRKVGVPSPRRERRRVRERQARRISAVTCHRA